MNPYQLLIRPSCNPRDAVDVFRKAEDLFRKQRYYLRGRQYIHHKKYNNMNYIAIQLPNSCYSESNIKETPANEEEIKWIQSRSRTIGGRSASECSGCNIETTVTTWYSHFIPSKEMGIVDIPDVVLAGYLKSLSDIMDNEDCRRLILKLSNASDVRSISAAKPLLLRMPVESNATPAARTNPQEKKRVA